MKLGNISDEDFEKLLYELGEEYAARIPVPEELYKRPASDVTPFKPKALFSPLRSAVGRIAGRAAILFLTLTLGAYIGFEAGRYGGCVGGLVGTLRIRI